MATEKKVKSAAPAGSLLALRVVSKSPLGTMRRAGFVFEASAQVVALADITPEQAEAIRAEPLLDVTETEIEPPAAKKA